LKRADTPATHGEFKPVDLTRAREEGTGERPNHKSDDYHGTAHGRRVLTFGGPGSMGNIRTDYVASIKNDFKVGGGDKKGYILNGPETVALNQNQLKARQWRKPFSNDDKTQGEKVPFGSAHHPLGYAAFPVKNPSNEDIRKLSTKIFIEAYGSKLPQKEPHEYKLIKEWVRQYWPEVSGEAPRLLVPRYFEYKKYFGK